MASKHGVLLVFALGAVTSWNVAAHKIHPLQNKYMQGASTLANSASEPVHEEITQIARSCQLNYVGPANQPLVCTDRVSRSLEPRGNKYDSLVRGVWWNDDPNQLLYSARQPVFYGWMKRAERMVRRDRKLGRYPASINKTYYVTYRSHYGDLQFLHAMASSSAEVPAQTREDILAWAEFTYGVATSRIEPSSLIVESGPERVRSQFEMQPGWTVRYLFGPTFYLPDAGHISKMAAGSLLHMIQDSYSASHVKRSYDPSPKCPAGRVIQFHSYGMQDADKHSQQDRRDAWQLAKFSDVQDPVNASATLLAFIEQKAEWPVVKSYLEQSTFCLDDDAELPTGGDFEIVAQFKPAK